MRHTSSFNILAAILILIGAVFLLDNFGIITGVVAFWPALPLILGTGFCMLFFRSRRKDPVLLGLGSTILLNSIFFFYLNFAGWVRLAVLWPVFIVILGMTFLACYIHSRETVLIYLAVFMIALGISFILVFAVSTKLWPLTLVLTGVSFIIINIVERLGKRGKPHAKKK